MVSKISCRKMIINRKKFKEEEKSIAFDNPLIIGKTERHGKISSLSIYMTAIYFE